jgi:uncharacterized membrane protein YraQ (UPF0718 family)
MKRKKLIFPTLFILFIAISSTFDYSIGKEIGFNFYKFFKSMASFLPAVFILIGIFEIWIEKEKIEKHLGDKSGFLSYLWAILLSGTTVGGLYIAFPIAHSLYTKGAKLSVIFTYVGAAAVARVPMSIYEANYVGLKFTIIRILVSLPLIIISSILLENYLKDKKYIIKK